MTTEEKIRIIEATNSFDEIPLDVFPKSHKEDYYFVSYSHKDYKAVFADILRLEECGINIWYDNEMHIGENWQEIAQLYISKFQCAGVIFYLTENSISSPACNQEVDYVLKHSKKFLSINKPLDGCEVQSGYSMLKELQKRGLNCEQSLLDHFEEAFSDEVLYLGINESTERKVNQISSIPKEELLQFEEVRYPKEGLQVVSCRDNTIINLDLCKQYEFNGNMYPVAWVGDCVFTNSIKLQNVKASDALVTIGESAFQNCRALSDFDLSHVQEIGRRAFKNCDLLEEIDLSNAKEIGEEAFQNCSRLHVNAINGSVGRAAFRRLNLKDIDYIAETPLISDAAFQDCKLLKTFRIKGTFANNLGKSAFEGCEALESAGPFAAKWSPDGTNEKRLGVGQRVFYGCKRLTRIEFTGAWDTENALSAFSGCSGLKELALDIKGTVIPDEFASRCYALETVTHSDRFTSIGENAFFYCESLKDFNLVNARFIDYSAFERAGIERVYLKNVQAIEQAAFCNCKSLKSVYIGSECKKLAPHAFSGCTSLETVKILSEDIEISQKEPTFDGCCGSIKKFYLRSPKVFDMIAGENVLAGLQVLYIGDNLDLGSLHFTGFYEESSDEEGFRKLVPQEGATFASSEDSIDITSDEINEPDPYSSKHLYIGASPFVGSDRRVSLNDLIGKYVKIKHRRLREPRIYFLEEVETCEDGMTIDHLVVSIHTHKSFRIDGSLVESMEWHMAYPPASDPRFDQQLDDPTDGLTGKTCCIVSNHELHYGVVIGRCTSYRNGTVVTTALFYMDGNEKKAVALPDIESITVFDENFETERVIVLGNIPHTSLQE